MSDDTPTKTLSDFLATHRNLILATHRTDGTTQMTPVWFIWENETFIISTVKHTVKWKNLVRDQRCSIIADEPEGHYVSASGMAELIDGDVYDDTLRIVQKYKTPAEIEEYMAEIYREGERTIIRLKPERLYTYGID